jgi:hypothetical protein
MIQREFSHIGGSTRLPVTDRHCPVTVVMADRLGGGDAEWQSVTKIVSRKMSCFGDHLLGLSD